MADKHWCFSVAFLALMLSACGESDADRVDKQLAVLCAGEVGLKVFERIEVAKEDYGRYEYMPWQYSQAEGHYLETILNPSVKYYQKYEREEIIKAMGYGEKASLTKFVHKIVRSSDQKLMAVHIDYGRSGGTRASQMSAFESKTCEILSKEASFKKDVFYTKVKK